MACPLRAHAQPHPRQRHGHRPAINQGVSTTIAGVFLPWVGACGYSSVFFTLAGFTVIYFITAAFFLPETKGRTLEEIEQYFTTGKMPGRKEEEGEAKA